MVTTDSAPWSNRRGKSRLGCLLVLLLVAVGAYYGVEVGSVYMDYWRLQAFMKEQARIAPSLSDTDIQRRVLAKIEELGLPEDARRLTVRRTARPREIVISTSYSVTIEAPFYARTITLTPEARQALY